MRSFVPPLTILFTAHSFAAYLDGPQDVLMGTDALQNILMNTDKSDKYHYPTDFTREIVPKPFHSHNDYWRDVPFYTGLSYGAVSTEADVWLINGTLYVRRLEMNEISGCQSRLQRHVTHNNTAADYTWQHRSPLANQPDRSATNLQL